ncbi:hypothetical protein [Vibrio cyclitrophicus]|uniref:hypothetical protein n=1 Tax=Vibrio cyclitrophicus TaxID=47951 RepID=UPI000C81BE3C|nr:hypothetical protein [Vibrio cyclitrophicus]PMF23803.1 hypothetical protein BCV18_18505 [Vibrio cyclitrophicus]
MTKSTHVLDVFQNNQYIPRKGWTLKNFKIKENESVFPLVNPDSYKRCKQPIYKEMREINYPRKGNDRLYKKMNTIEDLHKCWFHIITRGKHLRIYVLNPNNWEINFFHYTKNKIAHFNGIAHFTESSPKLDVAQETILKNTNKRVLPLKKNASLEENTAHNNELTTVVNSLNDELEKLRAEIRSLKS